MFCVSDLAILVAFVMVGRCWNFLLVLNSWFGQLGCVSLQLGIGKPVPFWSLVQISKRLLYAACCKISDFRRHLITFFFCEFLLCNYSVIIIQDARQGFIFISESWDLRVGRNVSSHIPPRICR